MAAVGDAAKPTVRVLYDYEYKSSAGEQVKFKKGTEYFLLKKANEEWWAVCLPNEKKPRFVPANYVEVVQKVEPDKVIKKKPPPPKPPKPKFPQPALDHDSVIKQFDQMLDTLIPVDTEEPEDSKNKDLIIDDPPKKPELSTKPPELVCNPEPLHNPVSTFTSTFTGNNGTSLRPTSMVVTNHTIKQLDSNPVAQATASLDRNKPLRLPESGHVRSASASSAVPSTNGETAADGKRPKIQPRLTKTNYNEPPMYANLQEISEQKSVDIEQSSQAQESDDDDDVPSYANLSTIQAHAHPNKKPTPKHPPPKQPPLGVSPLRYLDNEWCMYQDPATSQPYYYNPGTGQSSWDPPGYTGVPEVTGGPTEVTEEEEEEQLPKIPGMVNISTDAVPLSWMDKPVEDSDRQPDNGTNKSPGIRDEGLSLVPDDVFEATGRPNDPGDDMRLSTLQQTTRIREMQTLLNRTKISENGKKVKKSWSPSFIVTTGPFLYFYKDQKSAQPKNNMPVGKYDVQLDLRGATVDPPPKDLTSKKNVIMLTTAVGVQFLLQSDDKARMQDFATTISTNINMLGHRPEAVELPGPVEKPPESPTVGRSIKAKRPSRKEKSSTLERPTTPDDGLVGEKGKIKDWLLYWLLRRPTAEALKEKGIIKDRIFGSHLQSICDREKSLVPRFAQHCFLAVEKRGLLVDGIYRISGNMAAIQKLRFRVDSNESFDLLSPDWDIHDVSGALKLFFRELQEPLFPFNLYNKFTKALQILNRQLKLKAFQDIVKELPKTNFSTMKELFYHLKMVVEHHKENRMEAQNVAIVFGPTLMRPLEETGNMAANLVMQGQIVEYMILQYKSLF